MKAFRHRFWKFIFIFCHSGGKEKKNENCLRNPNAFLYFIHFDKQYKAQKGITGLGRLGRFTQPFWYRVCQPLGVMIDHVACFFSSINTPGLLRFQILGFLARRRETRRNRSEDGLRFLSLSLLRILCWNLQIWWFVFSLNFVLNEKLQPSHKTFRIKKKLAKKMRQNRPIPHWIRMRTDNTIRYFIWSGFRSNLRPSYDTFLWNWTLHHLPCEVFYYIYKIFILVFDHPVP